MILRILEPAHGSPNGIRLKTRRQTGLIVLNIDRHQLVEGFTVNMRWLGDLIEPEGRAKSHQLGVVQVIAVNPGLSVDAHHLAKLLLDAGGEEGGQADLLSAERRIVVNARHLDISRLGIDVDKIVTVVAVNLSARIS